MEDGKKDKSESIGSVFLISTQNGWDPVQFLFTFCTLSLEALCTNHATCTQHTLTMETDAVLLPLSIHRYDYTVSLPRRLIPECLFVCSVVFLCRHKLAISFSNSCAVFNIPSRGQVGTCRPNANRPILSMN